MPVWNPAEQGMQTMNYAIENTESTLVACQAQSTKRPRSGNPFVVFLFALS
jgi:hypothetical protein